MGHVPILLSFPVFLTEDGLPNISVCVCVCVWVRECAWKLVSKFSVNVHLEMDIISDTEPPMKSSAALFVVLTELFLFIYYFALFCIQSNHYVVFNKFFSTCKGEFRKC